MAQFRRPFQLKDAEANRLIDMLIDVVNNLDSGNIILPHASTTGQTANDHHAQTHASSHIKGGADANSGNHEINIIIPAGSRGYIKDSSGNNVASCDESGNWRIKGSVIENATP